MVFNRHSANLGKTILSEVTLVIEGSVIPITALVAQGTVVLALLILLMIVDPFMAISIGGILRALLFRCICSHEWPTKTTRPRAYKSE